MQGSGTRAVFIYGVLGLAPFLAAPVIAFVFVEWAAAVLLIQAAYAALILSFLGGVRWGLAVAGPSPKGLTISLSMLPTLAGLGILTFLAQNRALQLAALAVALLLHLVWDVRAPAAPAWFPRLRVILTSVAVAGLLAGVWVTLNV